MMMKGVSNCDTSRVGLDVRVALGPQQSEAPACVHYYYLDSYIHTFFIV